jgi:hypothetical protein
MVQNYDSDILEGLAVANLLKINPLFLNGGIGCCRFYNFFLNLQLK